ncbi:flagellar brake protein [Noviherbaspirillum sp. ST9]|uniref:flagellar brake protein n=1 Tax=Noviherbaspirillum sp. ST9 TaxID=3401606 RepID=UPI003B58661C
MRLQVGTRLQLILARPGKPAYFSSLIGYVSGEYLLVKLPVEHGLTVPLKEGERVTVRVFSGVSVYTFACDIESMLLSPRYYMHLSFPQEITATPLRSAARVKVNLPVEVRSPPSEHGSPVDAMLSDLSITGAFISAQTVLGAPGDRISVSFTFRVQPTNQQVEIRTDATICSSRSLDMNGKRPASQHGVGIHFDRISENEQFMLQHYLYEAENAVTP